MQTATISKRRMARTHTTARVESLESRTLLSALFVSTTGSDSAAGTLESPLATIQAAINKASAGDTINVRGGTYNLSSSIWVDKSALTIQSYTGETARVVAPVDNTRIENAVNVGTSNNIRLVNLDISGGYYYTVKVDGGDHLLISGSKLHDSGRDVVKLAPGSDYSVIENSEIYNSGRRDASNAEGVDAVGANYAVLRDSYIHDIATNGVYYKGGSIGTIIERNRVTRTGHSGILVGQSTDANLFTDPNNSTRYESIDAVVRNNVVWDVAGAGVGAWAALRPQIYNNTLHNVAKSMFGGLLVQSEGNRSSTDVTMYNNVVVVGGSRPVLNVRAGGISGFLKTDHNYFHSLSGTPQVYSDVHNYYGNVSGWQSRGFDAKSLVGDPGVDTSNGHRLLSTSGAIDKGLTISSVKDDMDRQARPAGGAYDIGSHEFTGTAAPAPAPAPEPEPAPSDPVSAQPADPTYTAAWNNTALPTQRDVFTVDFSAVPAMNNMDMIMGLSTRDAKAIKDLAAIARFNADGTIDASNGNKFAALTKLNYTAGTQYQFKFVVDLNRKTYDLYVTSGGTTTQIASNFAFRAKGNISQISNFATYNAKGDATISGLLAAPLR